MIPIHTITVLRMLVPKVLICDASLVSNDITALRWGA